MVIKQSILADHAQHLLGTFEPEIAILLLSMQFKVLQCLFASSFIHSV